MLIKLNSLFVNDQEKALKFYNEVLGLEIKENVPYESDVRWISLVSPEEPDGTELQLAAIQQPEAKALQEAMHKAGKPVMSLTTKDIDADYKKLVDKGVKFVMEPTPTEYGGPTSVDALFDDTVGNIINLHQE